MISLGGLETNSTDLLKHTYSGDGWLDPGTRLLDIGLDNCTPLAALKVLEGDPLRMSVALHEVTHHVSLHNILGHLLGFFALHAGSTSDALGHAAATGARVNIVAIERYRALRLRYALLLEAWSPPARRSRGIRANSSTRREFRFGRGTTLSPLALEDKRRDARRCRFLWRLVRAIRGLCSRLSPLRLSGHSRRSSSGLWNPPPRRLDRTVGDRGHAHVFSRPRLRPCLAATVSAGRTGLPISRAILCVHVACPQGARLDGCLQVDLDGISRAALNGSTTGSSLCRRPRPTGLRL